MEQYNSNLKLMYNRLGWIDEKMPASSSIEGINETAHRLRSAGGMAQQDRMIRDKQRSLERAVKYSYQGAFVKKAAEGALPARALINPNKLKQDYDDKIISVDFQYKFAVGDVFEWLNTGTYWLIYLQDLTELAYFRGDIRKCTYEIKWSEDGVEYSTYAAIRGPVETRIDDVQKHNISIDKPNYSLSFLVPSNEHTLKQFQRYSKFYLNNINEAEKDVCWRIEAVDTISVPGVIEVDAVEYYSNKDEDDIDNGVVGGLITKPIDPNTEEENRKIYGETFIKPKRSYEYDYKGLIKSTWSVDKKAPVSLIVNEKGDKATIKWLSNYSGQFDLIYGDCVKTIVVESLF